MSLTKMVNTETFRVAFKAVEKNSENMGLTMQNIRMQSELYEEFHGPKRTKAPLDGLSERY